MTIVITQPTFFPWIWYFEQIIRADVFIFLDCVQFPRRSWVVRNNILNYSKKDKDYINIIVKKPNYEDKINEVYINYESWFIDNLYKDLYNNYHKYKYYNTIIDLIKEEVSNNNLLISDFNIWIITRISRYLWINTKFLKASELNISWTKSELLINIINKVWDNNYYSALWSKEYMTFDKEKFNNSNINVEFQNFLPLKYEQDLNWTFISHLSILDLVFRFDKEKVIEIIKKSVDLENKIYL